MTHETIASNAVAATITATAERAAVVALQEGLTQAGQRKVNLVWEYTQTAIALLVVTATMGVAIYVTVAGKSEGQIPMVISGAFFLVTGFYFGRTNHARIGGVGAKEEEYKGR